MPVRVQLKGIREGLLVTFGDGPWDEMREALVEHVYNQVDFLRGAKLALDVGNQAINAAELGGVRDQLSGLGITLWAVLSNSPKTVQTAQVLGLATRLSKPVPEQVQPAPDTRLGGEGAVLVKRTLRSGYTIKHPGHVVVIGDVNPGAVIIAGGDVVVWGRLRGVVHAGAEGNEEAVVCALDLSPTQLRISDQIAVTPKRKGKPQPEVARILDGQVVAEIWNIKER